MSDGERTGHGFVGLRKRYVRRAEFLATDMDYRDWIGTWRGEWNRWYPNWWISLSSEVRDQPPQKLRDDFLISQSFHTGDRRPELFGSHRRGSWRLAYSPEQLALDRWEELELQGAFLFWPSDDFASPYAPDAHPARRFVCASLQTDPRLLTDVSDELFDEFKLKPDVMMPTRGKWALQGIPHDETTLCIPINPGMTANDLREAAPDIIRIAERVYGNRTPRARITTLRADGLTHKQIADRLGIHEATVASTLREANNQTLENV